MSVPRLGVDFDAVLFDAGGVLVVPDPVAIGTVLEPFGVRPSVALGIRAHYAGMRALEAPFLADISAGHTIEHLDWGTYFDVWVACVGVDPGQGAAAADAIRAIFSPFLWRHRLEAAVAGLWNLHQAGVPIGVVSNAQGQIEGVLRLEGVCQVGPGAGVPVAVVVDSGIVGVAKPDPAIFGHALAVLGLPAGRVAYVGDSVVNDVGGATAAGLHALHLDPFDDHADAAHPRIRSVLDLTG